MYCNGPNIVISRTFENISAWNNCLSNIKKFKNIKRDRNSSF